MSDSVEEGLKFCYEKEGSLVFDSEYKANENIFLFDKTAEELNKICKIITKCDTVYLESEDLSSVNELRFKAGAKVYLTGKEPLPENLDFSDCSEIHLGGRDLSKIPPQTLKENSVFSYVPYTRTGLQLNDIPPFNDNIDISRCSSVTITADLGNLSEMKFKDNAFINLSGCSNLPKGLDVSNCKSVVLNNCDLNSVNDLKFKEGADVSLANCSNIPADIDISRCSSIDISGYDLSKINNLQFAENSTVNLAKCANLPENLNVSQCRNINLSECDLTKVENLKFKEGSFINLSKSKLPENLDLSNCDEVDLSGCDLSNVKNLKFKDGAKINLSGCKNIPADIDISKCSEVNLSKCDLSYIANLELKDGVKLNLEKSKLPQSIDFSKCEILDISSCDLSHLKEIKFRNGAEIDIRSYTRIPENLDVSMCKEVWVNLSETNNLNMGNAHIVLNNLNSGNLDFSNLNNNFSVKANNKAFDDKFGGNVFSFTGINEIIFKDEAQYQDFLKRGQKLPEDITVSFSRESVKESMKQDQQKAKATIRRKQEHIKHNSPERTELKAIMKKKPIQNTQATQYQSYINSNSSTNVAKPLIFQKIKRQNG